MRQHWNHILWSLLAGVLFLSLPLGAAYFWRNPFYPVSPDSVHGFWAQRTNYQGKQGTPGKPYVEKRASFSSARDEVFK